MTRLDRQRGPPGARRLRLAHHVNTPKRLKGQNIMSAKTNQIEKAAARMRKIQEEKLRAAEKEREQKAEMQRLCGEALIDAATGGKNYGDFLNKTVAELAAHLGIIDPVDEAEDDVQDDDGANAPEVDYDGAQALEY